MSTARQTIVLRSDQHYGSKPPAQPLGQVLRLLPSAVRYSIRMAFEGRSIARGARPAWLEAASDVRFVAHDGRDETTLYFEAPPLGKAAPKLYEQQELWPTRPDAKDTGFDLLADVIQDVAGHNADSDRFDKPLLSRIALFHDALNGAFQELAITGGRRQPGSVPTITAEVISTAREFSRSTPRSQAVRVMGRLDMIRASTQSFALKLEDGNEVRGALSNGEISGLAKWFQQDVLVLGKAVFRPSGRLLRIDAAEVLPATDPDRFFSKLPVSRGRIASIGDTVRRDARKGGIAAIFGKWPGEESDEEIDAALRELS